MKKLTCSMIVLALGVCSIANAQVDTLPEDVQTALEEITQNDVTAMLTFLSSDELGGRDTPSPGLTVASSYIASRFRAAGLKGGAEGDSFFQVHEIATTQVTNEGITITDNGDAIDHFGLLTAGTEVFEFSGKPEFVSDDEKWQDKKFSGPVVYRPGDLSGPRERFFFMRNLAILKRNGATAVLLEVEEDNPMVAEARKALQPKMVNPRMPGSPPATLLVPPRKYQGDLTLKLPAQISGKAEVRNVIGVLPGSDEKLSEEAIIFTAHLDHVGTTEGLPDPIFNGADDDASGCTAVCEIADAFGALSVAPKRTVIFMTFWGEEKGLLGSRHYAANPEWPLEKTVANINIEMVGRPEPGAHEKAWMTGWYASDLGELMAAASKDFGVTIFDHPQHSDKLYRASDNASFVDKGVIAHSFSAGSLHEDYHQPGDEWEKIDIRHMTKVIQGLFVGSLPLANGEVTPVKTGKQR